MGSRFTKAHITQIGEHLQSLTKKAIQAYEDEVNAIILSKTNNTNRIKVVFHQRQLRPKNGRFTRYLTTTTTALPLWGRHRHIDHSHHRLTQRVTSRVEGRSVNRILGQYSPTRGIV